MTEIYWTVGSMGIALGFPTALKIEVLTKAANVIQFVGVTEAGYSVLFKWLGMSAAVGFTLWFVKLLRSLTAAAVGLAILNHTRKGLFRRQTEQPAGVGVL